MTRKRNYILAILGFILIGVALWKVPQRQAESFRLKFNETDITKLEPKDRVQLEKDLITAENNARTTLAQIIGGLILLGGLYYTAKNIRVNEEGKLTERFSKAVELLGSEYLDGRIGGIYALERIAKDSQKDHWTVMEVLTAFVREQSQEQAENKKTNKVKSDIQAALTVIARRKWHSKETKHQQIDLSGSYLPQANLKDAKLRNTILIKATLDNANFSGADLIGADISDASLDGADLRSAKLSDDNIVKAHSKGAKFENINLERALIGSMVRGLGIYYYTPYLNPYENQNEVTVENQIDTPFGTFICFNNGTFIDVTNNLMWIRAYWGMKFDGKHFNCQPVKISWSRATRLFGYGGIVSKPAGLRMEDIKETDNNVYKRGLCSVHFAEHLDWRLPTANEILTLSFCESDRNKREDKFDGYRYFDDKKSQELRNKLFPDCVPMYSVWSANENGGYGWLLDGHDNLGDYKKDDQYFILLVRNSEWKDSNTIHK